MRALALLLALALAGCSAADVTPTPTDATDSTPPTTPASPTTEPSPTTPTAPPSPTFQSICFFSHFDADATYAPDASTEDPREPVEEALLLQKFTRRGSGFHRADDHVSASVATRDGNVTLSLTAQGPPHGEQNSCGSDAAWKATEPRVRAIFQGVHETTGFAWNGTFNHRGQVVVGH